MAPGVITRGVSPQSLVVGIYKVFLNELTSIPAEWPTYANKHSSTKDSEKTLKITGIRGTVPEKPEGAATEFDEPVEVGLKTYTHRSYGLGIIITKEMRDDDQYDKINQLSAHLGRVFRLLPDLLAIDILNNATSTAALWLGHDSKPLLAEDHPKYKAGGVWANRPVNGSGTAVSVDISYVAIQDALVHFRKLRDDSDIPVPLKPNKIHINPEDEFVVMEALKSERKPDTANNNINTIKDRGLMANVLTLLTDDDFWMMQAPEHDLRNWVRTDTQFDNDIDFSSGNIMVKGFYRGSRGHGEPIGCYGGPGA